MTHPAPPENVQVEMSDGSRHPLECVYVGFVDGVHRWRPVGVPAGRIAAVTIAVLPPHTAIVVDFP